MARAGWGAAIYMTATPGVVNYPFTMAAWVLPTTIPGGTADIMALVNSASSTGLNVAGLRLNNVGNVVMACSDGVSSTSTQTTTTYSANTWIHACGVFAGAADRSVFLNGGGKASSAVSRALTGINRVSLAGTVQSANPSPLNARSLAQCALWNVALTDAEVASLAKGLSPLLVRPQSLVDYFPIWGVNSPEPNLKSNARMATIFGSPTKAENPRLILPMSKLNLGL